MDTDVDSVLRMVIGALFEEESKMLVVTDEVKNRQSLEMRKSGVEVQLPSCISVQRGEYPREYPQHESDKEHTRCNV